MSRITIGVLGVVGVGWGRSSRSIIHRSSRMSRITIGVVGVIGVGAVEGGVGTKSNKKSIQNANNYLVTKEHVNYS
jgi:DNA-binding transcriptional regulator LsrR (DeoR family)